MYKLANVSLLTDCCTIGTVPKNPNLLCLPTKFTSPFNVAVLYVLIVSTLLDNFAADIFILLQLISLLLILNSIMSPKLKHLVKHTFNILFSLFSVIDILLPKSGTITLFILIIVSNNADGLELVFIN